MTITEFIKKVNALSEEERSGVEVHVDTEGTVFIDDSSILGCTHVASLSTGSKLWHFHYRYDLPACVLKLMGELASDEYRGKFLILNGEPENSFCDIFVIGDNGRLYHRCEDTLDELVKFACTEEELDELKEGFSERMRKAIDVLAVPLAKVASKMGEDDEQHN